MTDRPYPRLLRRAVLPDATGYLPGAVVLRDFGPTRPHRYVTHQRNESGDNDLDGHYWGHYFSDFHEAQKDWRKRVIDRGAKHSALDAHDEDKVLLAEGYPR